MKNFKVQSNPQVHFEKHILVTLQENFPIQDNKSLDSVLAFIHEKLKASSLNLDYLEAELLQVTRKHKLQFSIKSYFKNLRKLARDWYRKKAQQSNPYFHYRRKKISGSAQETTIKSTYQSTALMKEMVKTIKEKKERAKLASSIIVKIPKVVFRENNDDILHQ